MDIITEKAPSTETPILTETGFYWREREGLKMLVCGQLESSGFANGFSTRLGGVSPFPENDLNLAGFDEDTAANIAENRRRFLTLFSGNFELATAWQVHGTEIKLVSDQAAAKRSDDRCDALISDLHGILVGVKTADCVPILIGDPDTGSFASVHAGWRGTVDSIVSKVVQKMAQVFGAEPRNMLCAIGPAASKAGYEVGPEVIARFAANFSTGGNYFTPTRPGHALADLISANHDQLLAVGVPAKNIYSAPFCTITAIDLFFSYRIEKKKYGKTGRLLSVIGKT